MARPKVLAVVLAGGEGNRLGALTEGRAKPAVPFGGMYRLIDFALSNCANSGLENVWVVEQYLPQELNEHLANGRPWDLDRSRGGLLVLPPYQGGDEEGFAEGNADALFRHLDAMREFGPDVVLVLSADHVFTLDLRDVVDAHLEAGAELTMVTKRLPGEGVSRYGVGKTNEGRITEFAYKPEDPPSDLVTAEVFAYDAARLFDILEELGKEELKDFGHELIPRLVERGKAREFRLEGYWRDVGTIPSYWEGHQDLLYRTEELRLDDPAWPIRTRSAQRLGACVRAGARVERCLLSPGCDVAGDVQGAILGPGAVVEEGAVVRDAIIHHGAVVRSGAVVERAILDEGVEVTGRVGGQEEIEVVGRERPTEREE